MTRAPQPASSIPTTTIAPGSSCCLEAYCTDGAETSQTDSAVFRSRSRALAEILRLDPVRDQQRIVFLTTHVDFPFDTTRALELALFRTFCVPSISALLHRTGEFERRAQKRYDDTDIIVSELLDWGYESERGRAAIRRMNQIHGRFAIANEDFTIRFIDRFDEVGPPP
jgi:hypothetical protein